MKFALLLILKFLAYIVSIGLLLIALILAFVGMVSRIPGNLLVFMSNVCFRLGNKIAKWLLIEKMKAALSKQEVKK
jgi:hypothetical protein